jgi:cytochrome c-type biogenesis protein CcmH/NrfF
MLHVLLELFGLALVVAGVSLWSVPLALVVAGVALVAAVEVRA